MNIVEAKKEIEQTIKIYLEKNEFGDYKIETRRQRPVFLVGAPGIGKTAIISQIASEMDLGLVEYSITHHTRQSAIGLPFIEKKMYGDKEYSVTEYTMSEIVAKVYDAIETQGKKEGILFIDEINCVSETLAPAMLELLQNKSFGPHKIPSGWILVSAGNPSEYNRSVNEFDVVTLDRVKKIEAVPDFQMWKKYAYTKSINEAVIGYLSLKQQNIFVMEKTVDGTEFVTPRGWEDMSVAINEYENCGFEVSEGLISEYVQNKTIAVEFYRYYLLFRKYREDYDVYSIMDGNFEKDTEKFKDSKFDERFAMIEVFISAITAIVKKVNAKNDIFVFLGAFNVKLKHKNEQEKLSATQKEINSLELKTNSEYVSAEEKFFYKSVISILKGGESEKFAEKLRIELEAEAATCETKISNIFEFLNKTFGKSQEITAYLVNLLADYPFVMYVANFGSESFYKYNELLLVDRQNSQLKERINNLKMQI